MRVRGPAAGWHAWTSATHLHPARWSRHPRDAGAPDLATAVDRALAAGDGGPRRPRTLRPARCRRGSARAANALTRRGLAPQRQRRTGAGSRRRRRAGPTSPSPGSARCRSRDSAGASPALGRPRAGRGASSRDDPRTHAGRLPASPALRRGARRSPTRRCGTETSRHGLVADGRRTVTGPGRRKARAVAAAPTARAANPFESVLQRDRSRRTGALRFVPAGADQSCPARRPRPTWSTQAAASSPRPTRSPGTAAAARYGATAVATTGWCSGAGCAPFRLGGRHVRPDVRPASACSRRPPAYLDGHNAADAPRRRPDEPVVHVGNVPGLRQVSSRPG